MHNLNVLSQMTNELTNVKVVCENEFWGGKVKHVFLFSTWAYDSEEGGFMTGYLFCVCYKQTARNNTIKTQQRYSFPTCLEMDREDHFSLR